MNRNHPPSIVRALLVLAVCGAALCLVAYLPGTRAHAVDEHTEEEPGHDHDHDHDHGTEADGHDHPPEEDPHAGHDHGNEDEHEEGAVHVDPDVLEEFGIEVGTAGPGTIRKQVSLPGEVRINQDLLIHVVPRVAGIVREVFVSEGDPVSPGDLLAVLESRELAEIKAKYLASRAILELASANYRRELDLWQKSIGSEQEYLDRKQAFQESRIEVRLAEQNLHALGFNRSYVESLPEQDDVQLTRYEITAPAGGIVLERHLSLGEVVDSQTEAITIADFQSVWVDLSVYPRDLSAVRAGQAVTILNGPEVPAAEGTIAFVSPLVGENTRTAVARVILPNPDGSWRPGLFIRGIISAAARTAPLVLPASSLQRIGEEEVVFLREGDAFRPVPVTSGDRDRARVEILSGIHPGDEVVLDGGFALKSEMDKASLEHAGHAH